MPQNERNYREEFAKQVLEADEELKKASKEAEAALNKLNENRKSQTIYILSTVAVLLGLIVFVATLVTTYISTNSYTISQGNFVSSAPANSYTDLLKKISLQQSQVDSLTSSLNSGSSSADVKRLNARVDQLQTEYGALSQTILEDPDKALTARLLREKQNELESQLADIKVGQTELSQRIDAIYTGGVVTVVVSLLIGVAGFCYRKIFARDPK